MANTSIRLINQAAAFSGAGKQQTAKDSYLANSAIDTRDKCTVSVQDVVVEKVEKDCEQVFVDSVTVKTWLKQFTLTYASVTPQIMARWAGYFFGATAAPTGTLANEVQTLTISNDAVGAFTLSLPLEGRAGITRTIPIAGLTAADLQAALVKVGATIGNLIKAGDVTVATVSAKVFTITYGGRLKNADLPLLTVGSTGVTTGTVTIAQTTAGGAKYHPFTRATSDQKPYFGFALVDKNSAVAAEKYNNAVCTSFTPTISENGDVGLTVVVLCDYEPEDVTGFAVPPCVNYTGLTTSDCRVKIGGNWETLDVFSQTMTLNDNVAPDFGFDSVNPDVLERGDSPDYSASGLVYGVKTDPFGVIVNGRQKAEFITHFGNPGDRFSLIAPQMFFKPQSNSRQFAGARNRRVIAFDGIPTRDGSNPPYRAEAYLAQTTAMLLT